jgi:hypothetical protein
MRVVVPFFQHSYRPPASMPKQGKDVIDLQRDKTELTVSDITISVVPNGKEFIE